MRSLMSVHAAMQLRGNHACSAAAGHSLGGDFVLDNNVIQPRQHRQARSFGQRMAAGILYLAGSAMSAPQPGQLCWQLGRFRLQVNSLYAARLASRSVCSSGGKAVATAVCVPLVVVVVDELAVGE